MGGTILLIGAILPLKGIGFDPVLFPKAASWPLVFTHMLFPRLAVVPHLPGRQVAGYPSYAESWSEIEWLLAALLLLFLLYLLALRVLPQRVGRSYILLSTLLLGLVCIFLPIITSKDVFSYVAYTRMGVIYHLNPLTALPTAIRSDPIYKYVYWTTQPSAYGPTWVAITCFLQWLILRLGFRGIWSMVMTLRLLGLVMHLASTWLVWSICRYLGTAGQHRNASIAATVRTRATLAFAWNPLLLFEACVNAHTDTTLLFFILLGLWLLVRTKHIKYAGGEEEGYVQGTRADYAPWAYLLFVAVFAVATCLKVNIALLFPGLLLYLWTQRRLLLAVAATVTYVGIVCLLYAPFWQGGAVLIVLRVNPATFRDINTISDFLSHLYNGWASAHGAPLAPLIGSPAERFAHRMSLGVFLVVYPVLCLSTLFARYRIDSLPRLLRWWALTWLLYCAIGASWFWPWYLITFFGLYALIEATSTAKDATAFGFLRVPLAVRLLAFSMLGIYCFYTWAPLHGTIHQLPGFLWSYFRGLWAWLLPLLALRLPLKRRVEELPPHLDHLPLPASQRQAGLRPLQ
jgi:hypothetical protein